jgi:DNA repair protein RecN (Recombination protein N)
VTGSVDAPTVIFDEIDAGIGGHTAHAIGALLRQLADHTQVLCVTHLPQVAARAQAHVVVERDGDGTGLVELGDDAAVIDELCRMMGADATDLSARDTAAALRGPAVGATANRTRARGTDVVQESLSIP